MYFLAIVTDRNIQQGLIVPGYILCQSRGKSKNRSSLRVLNLTEGYTKFKMPKVLVSTPYGHDDLVTFLSNYRTREHMHKSRWKHKATMKYFPHGALFWFPCDKYGEVNGPAIFIKKVPDKTVVGERETLVRLWNSDEEYRKKKTTFRLEEPAYTLEHSHVKAVIPQKNKKRYRNTWMYQEYQRVPRKRRKKHGPQ